jgi:hypothetical protein
MGILQARSCPGLRRIHREPAGVELLGVYYSRPPFYAALLRLLGWLPCRAAYWTFEGISLVAFAVFLICSFSSLCLPLLSNLLNGQGVTLVLLLAAGSILALRKDHDFVAGLLLSLCAGADRAGDITSRLYLPC